MNVQDRYNLEPFVSESEQGSIPYPVARDLLDTLDDACAFLDNRSGAPSALRLLLDMQTYILQRIDERAGDGYRVC